MSNPSASRVFFPARWIVAVAVIAAAALFAGHTSLRHNAHTPTTAVASLKGGAKATAANPATRARVSASYAALPLAFEANEGQTDPQVKYMARGKGYTLFLTSDEAVLSLASASTKASRPREAMESRSLGYLRKAKRLMRHGQPIHAHASPTSVAVLKMRVAGGNLAARAVGNEPFAGKSNYYLGNAAGKWHSGIAQYARVSYHDVYPGVDLTYHGKQNQLEFDFVVAPGADASPIHLGFTGARRIATDASGNLMLTSSSGNLTLQKPVAYQEKNGARQLVDSDFVLSADNKIGFKLGNFDHTRTLVIDPTLSYATYIGGNGDDEAFGIAADNAGDVYVTGESNSTSGFPGGNPSKGGYDAFVVKINADGTRGYTTFVGGSGDDLGAAINLDASGNAYVAGITTSTDFPTSTGAPQTTSGGGGNCTTGNGSGPCTDGFVFKLNSAGVSSYSTYIGGANDDGAFGITVDGSGNAWVTGFTFSSNFPTHNAMVSALNNNVVSNPPFEDAFVTKIAATGLAPFVYSTYLGGQQNDFGNAITVDPTTGVAFVVGATSSIDFPHTAGAFQTGCGTDGTCNESSGQIFADAFITELPADGGASTHVPAYSTYLGGSSDDFGEAIALDSSDNIYVTGQTTADDASPDFPVLGGFQTTYGSGAGSNAFVSELTPAGGGSSDLVYSSYLGGTTADIGLGIAVDASNNAYVTGSTLSSDFPSSAGFQNTLNGNSDAFVSEVAAGGGSLVYSSYLGGSGDENYDGSSASFIGGGIALDHTLNVHLAGTTDSSSDFPVTAGALESTYGGDPFDAFAATVLSSTAPDFTISASAPAAVAPGSSGSSTITLTAVNGYSSPVNLTCSVTGSGSPLPACSASSFSTNPATPTTTSMLTITTTGASGALFRPSNIFYATWIPLVGISLIGMRFSSPSLRRKKLMGILLLGMVLMTLFFLPACGGSSNNNGGGGSSCAGCTPAGSYTVTVTGTGTDANSLTHTATATLTVN